MFRRSRSLRARVSLIFILGTSVAVSVVLVVFYAVLDTQLKHAQEHGLDVRSDNLAAAIRSNEMDVVQRDPLAQYYGPQGDVLESSYSLGGRRLLGLAEARRLEARGSDHELDLEITGDSAVRLLSVPVNGGLLTVGVSADPVVKARARLVEVLTVAAPLLMTVVAFAGWRTVHAALAPVDRLTREAEAISSLESEARLTPVPGEDEIARLARTLDRMLERLRVAFGRERGFVDDASHELRTPIAVMRGELELAQAAAATGDAKGLDRALRAAVVENERLARLAEDLLLLARERAGSVLVRQGQVDLMDLAWAEARRLSPVLDLATKVTGDPVVVPGDSDRLRQVLANLLVNSRAAGANTLEVQITEGPTFVDLVVADDGPGFDAHMLDAAFERFARGGNARTRGAGGAGLGLAIVRAVVTAHGGTAALGNGPPLGGAVVTIRLPLVAPAAAPDPEVSSV
jgi:two-component system OmpR family sensor kinase